MLKNWLAPERQAARPMQEQMSVTTMLKRAYRRNLLLAAQSPWQVGRDKATFNALRSTMRAQKRLLGPGPGIRATHFVYGFKQAEEFPFYALMAVLSAQARHPAATTFFFVCHEPFGPFWEIVKERVTLIRVADFDWFGSARFHHYAHKADIIRMLAINEIGGLYLDCDTITLRCMDDLAHHDFVLGVQQTIPGAMGGFCNAIMIGRAGSAFSSSWIEHYRSFNSRGRDLFWDFHSVKLPMYLYALRPEDVHILPHDKWFFPLWNHIYRFMFTVGDTTQNKQLLQGQYAIHLWHNMVADILDAWSVERMLNEKCLYAELCLEALAALPAHERQHIAARLNFDEARLVRAPSETLAVEDYATIAS